MQLTELVLSAAVGLAAAACVYVPLRLLAAHDPRQRSVLAPVASVAFAITMGIWRAVPRRHPVLLGGGAHLRQ